MSSKPSTVPAWATSGTKTQPTSAKRAAGWAAKERPPGQFLNWLFGLIGDWAQYLSDGSFTGGVTVDTLHATSTAQVDGHLYQNAQESITLGPQTVTIAAGVAYTLDSNGRAWLAKTESDASKFMRWNIALPNNAHIKSWELFVNNVSAAGTMHARLFNYDAKAGVENAVGADQTLAGSAAGYTSMSETGLDVLVKKPGAPDGYYYYVGFRGGGTDGDVIGPLVVTYTIPSP